MKKNQIPAPLSPLILGSCVFLPESNFCTAQTEEMRQPGCHGESSPHKTQLTGADCLSAPSFSGDALPAAGAALSQSARWWLESCAAVPALSCTDSRGGAGNTPADPTPRRARVPRR